MEAPLHWQVEHCETEHGYWLRAHWNGTFPAPAPPHDMLISLAECLRPSGQNTQNTATPKRVDLVLYVLE